MAGCGFGPSLSDTSRTAEADGPRGLSGRVRLPGRQDRTGHRERRLVRAAVKMDSASKTVSSFFPVILLDVF